MRKRFLWILLVGSAALWVYTDVTRAQPCEKPIKYSLGSYDSRFKISKNDFKNAIDEATEIWENATGKNLFEYEPNPRPASSLYLWAGRYFIRKDIPVNLVYDERQEFSESRRELVSEVNEQKESADAIKRQFLSLQDKYAKAADEYRSLLSDYKRRRTSYDVLEAKRQEVNGLAAQVNNLIKTHNYLVGELNQVVQTINQTAGLEFEEGQYVIDEKGERITIFEFSDTSTLVRVLAHEFGHALGLEHNNNPDSIMYYLNESTNIYPTEDDLAGVAAVCKGR